MSQKMNRVHKAREKQKTKANLDLPNVSEVPSTHLTTARLLIILLAKQKIHI
jgi:hypothetical protein